MRGMEWLKSKQMAIYQELSATGKIKQRWVRMECGKVTFEGDLKEVRT